MDPKPLLIAGLAYLLIRGGQKYSAIQQFHYDIQGLPKVAVASGQGVITINFLITNVTNERFDIRNIFSRVMINNSYVGDVQSSQPFTIPAYGKTSVTLSLSVYLTNAITALISALSGNSGGVTVSLSGSVATNTVNVPISFTKRF